jgi:chaperone modulatory protein CbpM
MKRSDAVIEAVFDDAALSFDELCRVSAVSPQWLRERVAAGLLPRCEGEIASWRFDTVAVRRVYRMRRLERDFDAVPELAALVADLFDELDELRARLKRAGLD